MDTSVDSRYVIWPFGGCTVNNPLLQLNTKNVTRPLFKEIGLVRTPYALSPMAIPQLYKYCHGLIDIPVNYARLIYADPFGRVNDNSSSVLSEVKLCLVEISTPYDIELDGFIFNANRVNDFLLNSFANEKDIEKHKKRWKKALLANDVDSQLKNAQLLFSEGEIHADSPFDETFIEKILFETRCSECSKQDIEKILLELRKNANCDIALILHNYHYLPDGRAIIWPSNLNEDIADLAFRNKIPTYNPADLVARFGAEHCLADDFRHWKSSFYPEVAQAFQNFVESIYVENIKATAA